MDLLSSELEQYLEEHCSPETDLLKRLNRETYAKVLMPRMLSGRQQGRFLSMLSYMMQPERILEIGTYTGYSALCLAEGLSAAGELHTIDVNEELRPMVEKYINESAYKGKIICYSGNAMQIIPQMNMTYDMVFIDADKINYSHYFDLVIDKVRSGGFIIADNVLWSGKVLKSAETKIDKDTQALLDFNKKVQNDSRVENVIIPLRDGLTLMRKL